MYERVKQTNVISRSGYGKSMEEKIKSAYEKIETILIQSAESCSDKTEAAVLISMILLMLGSAIRNDLSDKIAQLFDKS